MELKKIIFRADGNSKIGLGHLFRLFSLVEMFKDKYECVFLTRHDSITNVIPEEYVIDIIPKNILYLEEPNWINKKYSSNEFIVIADGYQFMSCYQKKIKEYGFGFVYIDDLNSEKMYADIVINHSLNISAKDYESAEQTKFALGSEYALLRPKFIKAAKKVRVIKSVTDIFICFGGSDVNDLTNTALKGVIDIKEINKIHVVVGGAYIHDEINETIEKRKQDVYIYKNISEKEMLDLMSKCQLAIVPSSTVSYEACSVKMIILGGYYVDNQEKIYAGLESNGLIYSGGNFNKYNDNDFKQKVVEIINDTPLSYNKIITNQSRMFDGNQKKRFNKLIESIC